MWVQNLNVVVVAAAEYTHHIFRHFSSGDGGEGTGGEHLSFCCSLFACAHLQAAQLKVKVISLWAVQLFPIVTVYLGNLEDCASLT